jgi:hypothetical protein
MLLGCNIMLVEKEHQMTRYSRTGTCMCCSNWFSVSHWTSILVNQCWTSACPVQVMHVSHSEYSEGSEIAHCSVLVQNGKQVEKRRQSTCHWMQVEALDCSSQWSSERHPFDAAAGARVPDRSSKLQFVNPAENKIWLINGVVKQLLQVGKN